MRDIGVDRTFTDDKGQFYFVLFFESEKIANVWGPLIKGQTSASLIAAIDADNIEDAMIKAKKKFNGT